MDKFLIKVLLFREGENNFVLFPFFFLQVMGILSDKNLSSCTSVSSSYCLAPFALPFFLDVTQINFYIYMYVYMCIFIMIG